jgi:hypothetical protein
MIMMMQAFAVGGTVFIQGAVAASQGVCEPLAFAGETRKIHRSTSG